MTFKESLISRICSDAAVALSFNRYAMYEDADAYLRLALGLVERFGEHMSDVERFRAVALLRAISRASYHLAVSGWYGFVPGRIPRLKRSRLTQVATP